MPFPGRCLYNLPHALPACSFTWHWVLCPLLFTGPSNLQKNSQTPDIILGPASIPTSTTVRRTLLMVFSAGVVDVFSAGVVDDVFSAGVVDARTAAVLVGSSGVGEGQEGAGGSVEGEDCCSSAAASPEESMTSGILCVRTAAALLRCSVCVFVPLTSSVRVLCAEQDVGQPRCVWLIAAQIYTIILKFQNRIWRVLAKNGICISYPLFRTIVEGSKPVTFTRFNPPLSTDWSRIIYGADQSAP